MSTVTTLFDLRFAQQHIAAKSETIADCVNQVAYECHAANVKAGWWTNLTTGEKAERNVGEMLMLIVSEIAEGMEGDRKDLTDDKLPHRKMMEVELADALIRICDLAEAAGYDLGGAVAEKLAFNASRLDHTLAHRASENGKKY